MAKKASNNKKLHDLIDSISYDVLGSDKKEQKKIPDIITFIEDEEWLGLKTGPSPINLFPAQRIILKAFYKGSLGNEHIELNKEEIEWCKKNGLDDADPENGHGDILNKLSLKEPFRELVLIWGRRSGKDFIVSLIALYEAMRLLEVPGGDPRAYYGVGPGTEISILTVAASSAQAGIAFREIREKLRFSKYFADKYYPEGLQKESIYLLTPKDKENNEYFERKGLPKTNGSIIIEVGHSNPDTLVGKSCYMLILDEVASYKVGTTGAGSGDKIYALLQPTTSSYVREIPIRNENGEIEIDEKTGEPKTKKVYEAKVVSISSPRGKEGKLWDLWESHAHAPSRLACRLPTWLVNIRHTEASLKREFASMSNEEFNMEFGARFSGTAGENMFAPELIKSAFNNNLYQRSLGEPGKVYFGQLDPATNSHNYALAICHKEFFFNQEEKKSDFRIMIDLLKVWSPTPSQMIDSSQIDDFMVTLKRRFYLGMVAYDLWNSASSVLKLRKNGIPAIQRAYNRRYKMLIYTEFIELLKANKIVIPRKGETPEECEACDLLYHEMKDLQRRFDNMGFKVYPKRDGDGAKSDDVIDAVVGACYLALSHDINKFPSGKLVNISSNNDTVWRNMQGGIYGIGSGQKVMKDLSKKSSTFNYR